MVLGVWGGSAAMAPSESRRAMTRKGVPMASPPPAAAVAQFSPGPQGLAGPAGLRVATPATPWARGGGEPARVPWHGPILLGAERATPALGASGLLLPPPTTQKP